jgi:hypothetical protein
MPICGKKGTNFSQSADMEKLFHSSVMASWGLVLEQARLIEKNVGQPAATIVLCGGLGSSPYVKHRFVDLCRENFERQMTIVQPFSPWSVVCRGAASRRSRASYGFAAHEAFDRRKHDERDAFNDPAFGKRAANQMCWPVSKLRQSHIP